MIYYTMEDREEALERAKHSKEFIFIPAVGDPKPWKYWTPEERRREAAPNKNDAMKREEEAALQRWENEKARKETQISEKFQRGENLRQETESDILREMQEKRKIGGSFSFREYFRRIQQARNRQKA